nr:MAG TPA: hypothetical protein [Caudoviricetes sp.]
MSYISFLDKIIFLITKKYFQLLSTLRILPLLIMVLLKVPNYFQSSFVL